MKKVTIYTKPECIYCKMAKEFLKEKGIEYKERDVTKNSEAVHEMIHKSKQMGVPVLEINNEVIVGFDKEKLERIFEK